MKKFPFIKQKYELDCGPTCLAMICSFYGRNISSSTISEIAKLGRHGITLRNLNEAAKNIGFNTLALSSCFSKVKSDIPLPFIAHFSQNHFVVIYKITKKLIFVADPALGKVRYSHEEFLSYWLDTDNGTSKGSILVFEPTPKFYEINQTVEEEDGLSFILGYLKPYTKYILQLIFGLIIGSIISLSFPLLTQVIIDIGVKTRSLSFINLVLLAQMVLVVGQVMNGFFRNWIILHIGNRINIQILSDLLIKLFKLPISFFEKSSIGDFLQRISDQKRIESFLANHILNFLFGVFNLLFFCCLILFYSGKIFLTILLASIIYIVWIFSFRNQRKLIDYKLFGQLSSSQNKLIQFFNGIYEIKLHNSQSFIRKGWEEIQIEHFGTLESNLRLTQKQYIGVVLIRQLTNIFVTYTSAMLVITGELSLGIMLSIQYIIGQINSILGQSIDFFHAYQDAKISLDRLIDIHYEVNEEETAPISIISKNSMEITIENLSFSYNEQSRNIVLDNVSLNIESGKTTAIVGLSGCGKSTLLKTLLKFYKPTNGIVKIGNYPLSEIDATSWRERCGVVLQDGFIFNDTIANNICLRPDERDAGRIARVCSLVNMENFIKSLSRDYETKIGSDGQGLSMGQKQRILIARALYRNPSFVFLDEATNSLDSENEKLISENLKMELAGKTVIMVAHRLSTIKDADKIVYMRDGKITEEGKHEELMRARGEYYNLFINQANIVI